MRFLILSDIHANWEALAAVAAAAAGEECEQIVCLGDVVGYGADPNVCSEWVRAEARHVIRGNHDKASAGLDDLEWFNPAAAHACRWTMQHLTPENLDWLRRLPRGPSPVADFLISHGSPVDEDQYIVNLDEADQLAGYLDNPLTWIGHTHLQGGFEYPPHRPKRIPKVPARQSRSELLLDGELTYLLNPGSVGQPRDGDWRAAWATYDSEQRLVVFHRTEYDIRSAQAKILAAGLPQVLAMRLEVGH